MQVLLIVRRQIIYLVASLLIGQYGKKILRGPSLQFFISEYATIDMRVDYARCHWHWFYELCLTYQSNI